MYKAALLFVFMFSFILYGCQKQEDSLALYTIKGTIIDKQSSKPIPNIRVIRTGYQLLRPDTTFTDSTGNFKLNFSDYYSSVDKPVTITATDIDGTENGGLYKLFSMDVIFSVNDWTNNTNKDQYEGMAEKNVSILMSK